MCEVTRQRWSVNKVIMLSSAVGTLCKHVLIITYTVLHNTSEYRLLLHAPLRRGCLRRKHFCTPDLSFTCKTLHSRKHCVYLSCILNCNTVIWFKCDISTSLLTVSECSTLKKNKYLRWYTLFLMLGTT